MREDEEIDGYFFLLKMCDDAVDRLYDPFENSTYEDERVSSMTRNENRKSKTR
jgi:hypothetical protein